MSESLPLLNQITIGSSQLGLATFDNNRDFKDPPISDPDPLLLGGEVFILQTDLDDDDQPSAGKIQDLSGNGYHANKNAVSGTGPVLGDGKFGKSIKFDDSLGEYLDMDGNLNSEVLEDWSFSFWIYLDSDPNSDSNNNWRVIRASTDSEFAGPWFLILEEQMRINVTVRSGSSNYRYVDTSFANEQLTTETWHHLCYTYDSSTGTMTCYLDGSQTRQGVMKNGSGTAVPTGALDSNANSVRFSWNKASSTPNGSGCIPGRLDEIRMYNRVLSSSEVSILSQSAYTSTKRTIVSNPDSLSSRDFDFQDVTRTVVSNHTGAENRAPNRDFEDQSASRITGKFASVSRSFSDDDSKDMSRPISIERSYTHSTIRSSTRSLSSNRVLSDSFTRRFVTRPLSAERTWTDSVQRIATRSPSSSRTLSDSVTRSAGRNFSSSRTFNDQDLRNITRVLSVARAFLDNTVSRDVERSEAFDRQLSDSVVRTSTRDHAVNRSFNDDDARDIVRVIDVVRTWSDNVVRSASRLNSSQRSLADTVDRDMDRTVDVTRHLSDSFLRRFITRPLDATRTLSDDSSRIMERNQSMTRTLSDDDARDIVRLLSLSRKLTTSTSRTATRKETSQRDFQDSVVRDFSREFAAAQRLYSVSGTSDLRSVDLEGFLHDKALLEQLTPHFLEDIDEEIALIILQLLNRARGDVREF